MHQPCVFGDPRDPNHCWHWDAMHGVIERDGSFSAQRCCCWCGRLGLAKPRGKTVVGHGPLLVVHGGDANGAEFVA